MNDIKFKVRVAKKMIADMRKLLDEAVKAGNWRRAGELDAYISGMEQILVLFDLPAAASDKE
jgi:hypothetical protein